MPVGPSSYRRTVRRGLSVEGPHGFWSTLLERAGRAEVLLRLALCIAATGFFATIDLAFLSAALFKILEGGWFPLALGILIFPQSKGRRRSSRAMKVPQGFEIEFDQRIRVQDQHRFP